MNPTSQSWARWYQVQEAGGDRETLSARQRKQRAVDSKVATENQNHDSEHIRCNLKHPDSRKTGKAPERGQLMLEPLRQCRKRNENQCQIERVGPRLTKESDIAVDQRYGQQSRRSAAGKADRQHGRDALRHGRPARRDEILRALLCARAPGVNNRPSRSPKVTHTA